jgi:hypothetical protein
MGDTPDLEAIATLTQAATPGPWIAKDGTLASQHPSCSTDSSLGFSDGPGWKSAADLEFCAAARSAIPAILDRIAALERLRDALEDITALPVDLADGLAAAQFLAERALRRCP